MKDGQFSYSNAFSIRLGRAVEEAGGRGAILASVVSALVAEHGANLLVPAYLRARGGWTRLIEAAIGERPRYESNEIGMPTTPAYLVWTFKRDHVADIRELTIRALETAAV